MVKIIWNQYIYWNKIYKNLNFSKQKYIEKGNITRTGGLSIVQVKGSKNNYPYLRWNQVSFHDERSITICQLFFQITIVNRKLIQKRLENVLVKSYIQNLQDDKKSNLLTYN